MALTLDDLRTDPLQACTDYGLLCDKDEIFRRDQGGQCGIHLSRAPKFPTTSSEVYRLEPAPGNRDWFFPYSRQVGFCIVPIGQPEGTIAFTGGMNGCTLAVYRHENSFHFYHDTNGMFLANRNPPGERVCYVPVHAYQGPLKTGERLAREGSNLQQKAYFRHNLICVRSGNEWKVIVTGILNYSSLITGLDLGYEMFKPWFNTCLLTTFRDR